MKKICFDLDGTLCTNTWGKYEEAKPIQKAIDKCNALFEKGYSIIIFTARFMGRSNEDQSLAYKLGYDFTKNQIDNWGIKYHKLIMGKPSYDIIIDDKHYNYNDNWIDGDFEKIYNI